MADAAGAGRANSDGHPRITQLHPLPVPGQADTSIIDIIAVHGMDTKSPDTWVFTSRSARGRNVNWLQDEDMLPRSLGRARILTCNWPAELFRDPSSVEMVIAELAQGLLLDIQSERRQTGIPEDRPLAFIASCLGGVVLIKALTIASRQGTDYHKLFEATRGIVFLATPFRGTSLADLFSLAVGTLRVKGLVSGHTVAISLLNSVGKSTHELEELVNHFTKAFEGRRVSMYCFYETQATDLAKKALPGWLSQRLKKPALLVERASARLDSVTESIPLDRTHVMMNKFSGPNDVYYLWVVEKLMAILDRASRPDDSDAHASAQKLTISASLRSVNLQTN